MAIRKYHFRLFLSFFLICLVVSTFGQPGTPDPSFNGNGLLLVDNFSEGGATAVQPDGKIIIVGGGADVQLNRYNPDGSPDLTFGVNGIVSTNLGFYREYIQSVVVQPDGKIIVAGYADLLSGSDRRVVVARYLPGGSLDITFNSTGQWFWNPTLYGESINDIALQDDGKIVLAGRQVNRSSYPTFEKALVVRLNSEGLLDNSFDADGIMIMQFAMWSSFNAVTIQSDQKIVAVGYSKSQVNGYARDSIAIVRINVDGSFDPSFSGDGRLTTSLSNNESMGASGNDVLVQPDGKINIGGFAGWSQSHGRWVSGDMALLRLLPNGDFDTSFHGDGFQTVGFNSVDNPYGIALQSDGKIILAGIGATIDEMKTGVAVARLTEQGELDNTFGTAGKFIIYHSDTNYRARGLNLHQNRIYVGGSKLQYYVAKALIVALQNDGLPLIPQSINLCPSLANAVLPSGMSRSAYQWQSSSDSVVFTNLTPGPNYAGVNSSSLWLLQVPSSWYGLQYRCVTNAGNSNVYTIQFKNNWTGSQNQAWENPANWSCGTIPDAYTDVLVSGGSVTVTSNTTIRSLLVTAGGAVTVAPGVALTVLR